MANLDRQYKQLCTAILESGYEYTTDNRSETYYKQISSATLLISLEEFPILTTKQINFKNIVAELLWFLRGEDNINFLLENNCNIWNQDAYNWYLRNVIEDAEPKDFVTFFDYVKKGGEWDEECKSDYVFGSVGRNYGVQWVNWKGSLVEISNDLKNWSIGININQIENLLDNLRKPNPINRRHIVTAWNPAEINNTALPPCHWAFEIIPFPLNLNQKIKYSSKDKVYLNGLWTAAFSQKDEEAKKILLEELKDIPDYGFELKWHQRSVDTFLGLPYNITSYALLAYMIGSLTNMLPVGIIGDLSNVHFYNQHFEAVKEQMKNDVNLHRAPTLKFSENFYKSLEVFKTEGFNSFISRLKVEDFILENYTSFEPIKAKMIAEDKKK